MRQRKPNAGAWLLAIALAMGATPGAWAESPAETDWLEEMPEVMQVVEVVAREFNSGPTNDDYTASNLAGTFALLRRIIEYKASLLDKLPGAHRDRIRALTYAYLQAELVIGLGTGRRSTLRTDCNRTREVECYQRWFHYDLVNAVDAVRFQEKILPLLFDCDRAKEYVELKHSHAMSGESPLFSPAEKFVMPPDLSLDFPPTLKVAERCTPYGGDADQDGLCDAWEGRFEDARARKLRAPFHCGELMLKTATTKDAKSVTVEYTTDNKFQAQPVTFRIYRAAQSTLAGGEQPLGEATVILAPAVAASPDAPGKTIDLLKGTELPVDTNRQFVIVVAKYGGRDSTAWFQKHPVAAIVHGYTFRKGLEIVQEWEKSHSSKDTVTIFTREWILNTGESEPWQSELESDLERFDCYDPMTFSFPWRYESITNLPTILSAKGEDLYQQVKLRAAALRRRHPGDVIDVHFIGHSRGAVLVGQALMAWSRAPAPELAGSYVMATLLDPHPANNSFGQLESVDDDPLALGSLSYTVYTQFQDDVRDPKVMLPAGVGLREVLVWYQHSTVAQIHADPPDADDNGIPDLDEWAFPVMNLWGQGNARGFDNQAGLPIRTLQLFQLGTNSGTITHGTVPLLYDKKVWRPIDPLIKISPANGNCGMPPH